MPRMLGKAFGLQKKFSKTACVGGLLKGVAFQFLIMLGFWVLQILDDLVLIIAVSSMEKGGYS